MRITGTSSRAVRSGLLKISIATQEDTQLVKPVARLGTLEVTADGEGLVSHAGVALLVELADRVGLTGRCPAVVGTRSGARCTTRGGVARRGGDAR